MVRRDVEQDGDVGTKLVHVVQLERTELDDIIFVRILCHLQRQAPSDVTSQSHVVARILEDVVDEACRGGLAVASRDADHLAVGVAARKLYLADDGRSLLDEALYHRDAVGDARALDDLVCREHLLLRVVALLPCDAVVVEQLLVLVLHLRCVGDKHVEALLLGQHGSTCAALAGSKNYDSFHLSFALDFIGVGDFSASVLSALGPSSVGRVSASRSSFLI